MLNIILRETASGVESLGDKAEEFAKKMEESKYGEVLMDVLNRI